MDHPGQDVRGGPVDDQVGRLKSLDLWMTGPDVKSPAESPAPSPARHPSSTAKNAAKTPQINSGNPTRERAQLFQYQRNQLPLSALRCHRDRLSTTILAPFLAVVLHHLVVGLVAAAAKNTDFAKFAADLRSFLDGVALTMVSFGFPGCEPRVTFTIITRELDQ